MHEPLNVRHHHGGGLLLEAAEAELGVRTISCVA